MATASNSHGAEKSAFRRWAGRVVLLVLVLAGLSVALVLPLRWFDPATTAFILRDESGREPVAQEWHSWSDLGPAAPLSVIAAEDQRFADHFGIDVESIRKSLEDAEQGDRLRGASTISQQLTKNLFLWSGRSYLRKGLEAYLTVLLEACLPKRRILELYLNVVELGPGIYGYGAGSQHFFGKSPAALTFPEAALLAAVLPNPARLDAGQPSDYLRERQQWIVGQMQRLERESWLYRVDPPQ